jgi:amino acid adenylation domain-containing protein
MVQNLNPAAPLYQNSLERPHLIAVRSDDTYLTYAQLAETAQRLASLLRSASIGEGSRVGILASRSAEACVGVLGASWVGATYVPIPTKVPEDRLLRTLALADVSALIADARGMQLISGRVLEALPNLIVVPNEAMAVPLGARTRKHIHILNRLPNVIHQKEPIGVNGRNLAYIEFTSGTTGTPKGVMISAVALHHYVSMMQDRYTLGPGDCVAETAELSFDISVSNMFTTWNAGASLYILSPTEIMAPIQFIQTHGITSWFSVPSIIGLMNRIGALQPGALPSLRWSLFCGEPLPRQSALAWQAAAPNSVVDNLYGPTEATVLCLAQRLTDPPVITPHRDIIAIGVPLPGTEAAVVDTSLEGVPMGQQGELALSGPQLAEGYFCDFDLTASRFRMIKGKRWYLTGDLAVQDQSGRFHHLGRVDNQVKILGMRVELEDIEAHLRAVCGTDLVAAVPWPMSHGAAEGVIAFVVGAKIALSCARSDLVSRLPAHMVPTMIHSVDTLPMNSNGKLDRRSLLVWLDQNSVGSNSNVSQ